MESRRIFSRSAQPVYSQDPGGLLLNLKPFAFDTIILPWIPVKHPTFFEGYSPLFANVSDCEDLFATRTYRHCSLSLASKHRGRYTAHLPGTEGSHLPASPSSANALCCST